jgi:hypothetical protein
VDGKEAGELPLQPIVARTEKTDATLAECGVLIAESRVEQAQYERVLGDLFTLQLHGVADTRIDDCRKQLFARVHHAAAEAARYQAELERAQLVLAGLEQAGHAQAVPPRVRKTVSKKRPPDRQTLDWAVKNLPVPEREVCTGIAKVRCSR